MAVCLAGGLRLLELTALSLVDHLFPVYPSADVFVSAPLDETSHKVILLEVAAAARSERSWGLKGIHFIAQAPLDDSGPWNAILSAKGSPNGIQVRGQTPSGRQGLGFRV